MSDMRERFEAIHCGYNKHNTVINEHGDYVYPSIRDAYSGFCTAWSVQQQTIDAQAERINKLIGYAEHYKSCDSRNGFACNCGLDKALTPKVVA